MKVLTIIPARCGSKGIQDKNIIDVCGKPLLAYSIEPAIKLLKEDLVSEVIVSTDCQKIANIANRYGAKTPFLRPEAIAGDKAKSIEFIIHAIEFYEKQNIFFDAVLLLQPTSPLRTYRQLQEALSEFKSKNADSLISCYKEEYINDLVMYRDGINNFLEPLNDKHNKGVRRQDHGSIFVRNGAVYITKVEYLKKTNQIISDNPLLLEMKKSDSINIDTLEDLEMLKRVLCK